MRFIMNGSIGCGRCARRAPGFQVLVAAALLCAVQAGSTWAQTPTAWTNASGGVWSDSASWSNGVPNGNDATLSVTGVSYTVTYDAPATAFRDLIISNSAGFTSTLNIASTAFASGRTNLFKSGAVVNVNAGGDWRAAYGQTGSVVVQAGASLNINGGTMLYTNLMQGFVMSLSDSSGSATSVLNLTSGRFEFGGTNDAYLAFAGSPKFNLGNSKPGIVNISGGTCVVQKLYGLDLGSSSGGRGYVNITGGELVFTGQTATTGPYISLGRGGGYGEINISGNGKLTAYARMFAIGYFPSASYGHLTLNGGSASFSPGGLALGSRGNDCTGIVTVISGQLTVVGGVGNGILLGYDGYYNGRSDGLLEIFGGNVTVSPDIYAGYATGNRTNKMGRITITNGLLYVQGSFYVGSAANGGRAAGELNLSGSGIISNTLSLYVGNGTGAVGVFNQTGGRYNQNGGVMYVGYNGGDGTFKMIGSQGALTVPALAATTSTSRISFDLGPNGAGTVTVSGAVSISTNTSLEITVTNYDWSANGLTVDLIGYGTLSGVFGATNVTIVGAVGGLDGGAILYGDGSNDKIRLQLNRRAAGTFFKFR